MKLKYVAAPSGLSYQLFNRCLRRMAKSFDTYHPVSLNGELLQSGQRACSDRWEMIAPLIEAHRGRSLLDLGCAEGYFVRRAAEQYNCFSLGVDADFARILVAQNCVLLDGVKRAAFAFGTIDRALLDSLPIFDVVIFLSVMHHVIYEHGVEYGRALLTAIRERTRKFLVFDMGQSNEIKNEWAKLLPEMGTDPGIWIAGFLRSAGYSEVSKLGETDSYRNDAGRSVFVAKP
jgi:cyclopropane fatty-acyl-phospholipid synthase-like methyltransferase